MFLGRIKRYLVPFCGLVSVEREREREREIRREGVREREIERERERAREVITAVAYYRSMPIVRTSVHTHIQSTIRYWLPE